MKKYLNILCLFAACIMCDDLKSYLLDKIFLSHVSSEDSFETYERKLGALNAYSDIYNYINNFEKIVTNQTIK